MEIFKKLKENWKDILIISLNILIFLFLAYIFFASSFTISSSKSFNSIGGAPAERIAMPSYNYGSRTFSTSSSTTTIKSTSASVDLETYDYYKSKDNLMNLIKENKGYILNEREDTNDKNYKSLDLTIKIPSENVDAFIRNLKTCCKVTYLSINTQDRTKTYNDYQDRIKRYEEQVEKYKAMLQKNITVEEEVKIQNRIDTLENEIAYLENTLETINESSKYSKIYLTLYQKETFLDTIDFITLKDSVKAFLEALNAGIVILIYILGFVIPFLIIFGIYKLIKPSKKDKKEKENNKEKKKKKIIKDK